MKTIVITGSSGSGKSYLSNKLANLYDNSIVIKTDSYYRDCLLIKFLSIFIIDIYDRPISIKTKEIKNTLNSVFKKVGVINSYYYDFKKKKSLKSKIKINYKGQNQFLIIEGIFAHRLDLNYKETINIVCKEEKTICFKRRLKRDKLERARNSKEVNKRFNSSWYLFYKNIKKFLKNNKVIVINPVDNKDYNKLIIYLKQITLTKKINK